MSDLLCAPESVQTDSPPLSPSKTSPSEWVVVTKQLTRTVSPDPTLTDSASSSLIAHHHSDAFVAAETSSSLKRKLSQSPEQDHEVTKSSTWEDRLIQSNKERDREAIKKAEEGEDAASDFSLDSRAESEDSSSQDMAHNPATIRQGLEDEFMYVDRGHFNQPVNADFKANVMKVMKSSRESGPTEADMSNFQSALQNYCKANETTLVHKLVPLLMNESFGALDVDDEGNPVGEYRVRGFDGQGVVASLNRLFSRERLPCRLMYVPGATSEMITSHFDASSVLSTPKPDFAYGIDKDRLPQLPFNVVMSEKTKYFLDVAPSNRDIFFIWENKSGSGNLIKCGNQALRAASAVIHASRQLRKRMGENDTPGIDKDTFIYAATNSHNLLEIFVAYAWVPAALSPVEFCMDSLGSLNFTIGDVNNDPLVLANLRRPLHNIIEWGTIKRMKALRERYDKLWQFERKEMGKTMAE